MAHLGFEAAHVSPQVPAGGGATLRGERRLGSASPRPQGGEGGGGGVARPLPSRHKEGANPPDKGGGAPARHPLQDKEEEQGGGGTSRDVTPTSASEGAGIPAFTPQGGSNPTGEGGKALA